MTTAHSKVEFMMHLSCVLRLGVLLSASWGVLGQNVESRVVNIVQGPVRGYKEANDEIYTFFGIPYATAPNGTQKFKAPLPPPTWTDTFEAVNSAIICPQAPLSNALIMREDCLVANVFVPNVVENNLPVVVIVHGGAYQMGWGNMLMPWSLVRKSVIAVTFNYRLGAHGFLCLGTENVPGNAGMKDQMTLLRWVRDNIASFGGNPNDVTIAGCSAGGGSVDLLTLSKTTNGLFNKAILESGASIGSVGVQTDPLANGKYYAGVLNFGNVDDITALEEFYTTASLELLISRADVVTSREDSEIIFGPCVEKYLGEEMFLDDGPLNILASGEYTRVPLYYGFAEMEGILFLNQYETWKTKLNETFSEFLPVDLEFENDEQRANVANEIREFYFGNIYEDADFILSYIDFLTDTVFAYPMLRTLTARIGSNNDSIYLYEYSFVDENTAVVPYTDVRGATHCAQCMAVLRQDENITDAFRDMKEKMVEFWINFITTGNPISAGSPVPAWPLTGADRSPHLSIGQAVELRGVLLPERAALWDRIYAQHYRAPIPPNPEDYLTDSAVTITTLKLWIISLTFIAMYYY